MKTPPLLDRMEMADSKVRQDYSQHQLAQMKMANMSRSEPSSSNCLTQETWRSKPRTEDHLRNKLKFIISIFGVQLSSRRVETLPEKRVLLPVAHMVQTQ